MKKLIISVLFLFLSTEMLFSKDNEKLFTEVKTMARLEFFKIHAAVNNKILLVYFHTYKCGYCEKMKNKTFSNAKVKDEIQKNYIAVSVDYTKYKQEFKKTFELKATPATLFFDKKSNLTKHSFYGYKDAKTFYQIISSIGVMP